jgi:uncharacterized YigZ family protein
MKYKTIAHSVVVEQNIKKSIFIGSVNSVQSTNEAKQFIEEIKVKYKDANHNAYAFRVGLVNEEVLYSDDGEPSKTAGLPIYNAIRSSEVRNVVVVITRYFGGTKLGVPGLIGAYGETAKFAIESASIVEKVSKKTFFVKIPFSEMQFVNYNVNKFDGSVIKRTFGVDVEMTVEIDEDAFDCLKNSLLNYKHSIVLREE